MSKVGLFGGSFDPVHQGHIKLALLTLEQCELDEVWFVVAYDQPLKDKHFESFENRVKLLEIATEAYPQLKVITLEETLSKPSYSYNTVKALKEMHPKHEFKWIIGSDNAKTLDKWYRIDDLKAMIEFIVVTRNHETFETFQMVAFDDESSSTAIRNGDFKYLDKNVREAIFKNHFYEEAILYNNLSKKRADHVMRCVEVGLEIASYHEFDMTKVYEAIVLHDITKELDKELELQIMKEHFSNYCDYHHKVYHQFTGSYIAQHQYLIEDEDVLIAIMHHTTGTDEAPLSKLIYVADKVERGRPYDTEGYIALAKKDLDAAFQAVKKDAEAHRKDGK